MAQASTRLCTDWQLGDVVLQPTNQYTPHSRCQGTIPEIFCISETSYKELMSMNLGNNRFTGTLPKVINGLITMASAT